MNQRWVKQCIPAKNWYSFYQYNSSYCFLEIDKEKNGVWAGFVVADNNMDNRLSSLTPDELRIVDDYRRSHYVYPRPLEEVKV